jgi:hypothetical protein
MPRCFLSRLFATPMMPVERMEPQSTGTLSGSLRFNAVMIRSRLVIGYSPVMVSAIPEMKYFRSSMKSATVGKLVKMTPVRM